MMKMKRGWSEDEDVSGEESDGEKLVCSAFLRKRFATLFETEGTQSRGVPRSGQLFDKKVSQKSQRM
jgi:hypothetical protein